MIRTSHSDFRICILAIIFSLTLHAGIIFLIQPGTLNVGTIQGKELEVRLMKGPQKKSTGLSNYTDRHQNTVDSGSQPDKHISFQNTQTAEAPIAIPEERYYKLDELDVTPRPVSLVNPAYPDSAPPYIKHGSVKLLLKLDESGVVTDAIAIASEPEGFFENTAREAFIGSRFTPGVKDGANVKTQLTLTIHFNSPLLSKPQ